MTNYVRRGHYRLGINGDYHWVSAHIVQRDTWSGLVGSAETVGWTRWHLDEDVPNSRCPICREPVWFYRNPNGGCAYFDELGWPWPKHPCMDRLYPSIHDRTADWQAREMYRTELGIAAPEGSIEVARAAYAAWIAAREVLISRDWEEELVEAEDARDEARDRAMKIKRTTAAARLRNRERLESAAKVHNDLQEAHESAIAREKETRELYLEALDAGKSDEYDNQNARRIEGRPVELRSENRPSRRDDSAAAV